ncbi:MAG: selenium-dependent molybdenum cofactor biosynthesis protein YqeB [Syntrophorhabdus sp.]
MKGLSELSILIKGAGEMASGIAHRLHRAGIPRIVMLEIERPLCVRRFVSFCEAVQDGSATVEGITARRVAAIADIAATWEAGEIPVMIDPEWTSIKALSPDAIVDAVMAKRNLGTQKSEAGFVIGVGPGFTAPRDVHAVIESNRGHDLGRVIYDGCAEPYTGVPGEIKGLAKERVLRAPEDGQVRHVARLGDEVKKDELILYVNTAEVRSPFDGILRGLIREINVNKNEKIGDVDPRARKEFCYTISEKARAIGGGVLEAILHEFNGKRNGKDVGNA